MIRAAQLVLFSTGGALLLYHVYIDIDRQRYEHLARLKLLQPLASASPSADASGPQAVPRELVGRLEIPRIGLSVMVNEGTSALTLRRSVGHIEGTAHPGQIGNVGLAGHRDTDFWPLRNVQRNDVVTLTTTEATYRYRVVSTRIVNPQEVSVLAAGKSEVLTLVTCYPFYFIGMAPSRFIVRAERLDAPKAPDAPRPPDGSARNQ